MCPFLPSFLLGFNHLVNCPFNGKVIFQIIKMFTVPAEPGGVVGYCRMAGKRTVFNGTV
jgi:hypothetical protein